MVMAAVLALIWNAIGGTAMYLGRNRVRRLAAKSPFGRGATFVVCSVALALLEDMNSVQAPCFSCLG